MPKESLDSFSILADRCVIDSLLAKNRRGMAVGLRNTMVDQYQSVNPGMVVAVIEQHIDDLITFTKAIMNFRKLSNG